MSTGECVDCVLVFKLPSDAAARADVAAIAADDAYAQRLSHAWRKQEEGTASAKATGLTSHQQHAVRRWSVTALSCLWERLGALMNLG